MQTKKLAIAIALMAVVLASCGKKEPAVVKVGKEVITVSEFKNSFVTRFNGEERAKQRTYQDRERHANEMAIALAKYQEGLAIGIDKLPIVKQQTEQLARRRALDFLYEEKVINVVTTDAAAKEFYEKSGVEVKARHILLKSSADLPTAPPVDTIQVKARIDSIKGAIEHGLDFKAAAKLFSQDNTSAADSGDLGYFPWGRMVEEFQNACWSAKLGVLVGPVRSQFGYHLIVVEDKRPVPNRKPYDEMKETIKRDLQRSEGQKMQDIARKYVEDLRKKNSVDYKNDALELFRSRMADPASGASTGAATLFTEEQKAKVATSYKGGQVSIGQLIEKLGQNAGRVDWKDKNSVVDLVNSFVEPKLLEKDAEAQGYYRKALKDPQIKEQVRTLVVGQLEKQEVTDKINPGEPELRRYYEAHLANFIQPELRTVREIFIKEDSLKAVRVLQRAKKGENFKTLAWRFNEKESTKLDTGRIGPFEERQFGITSPAISALKKIGDITRLERIGKNFAVIQLIGITPSRTKTFEEAQAEVMRQYRTTVMSDSMQALEKRSVEKFKVDIDAKALGAVWPLPDKPADKAAREP